MKNIMNFKMSDYKIVDVILKTWLSMLTILWIVGMISLLYHIATDPSSIENVKFGIFDTL
jgi:hypothetical protein